MNPVFLGRESARKKIKAQFDGYHTTYEKKSPDKIAYDKYVTQDELN